MQTVTLGRRTLQSLVNCIQNLREYSTAITEGPDGGDTILTIQGNGKGSQTFRIQRYLGEYTTGEDIWDAYDELGVEILKSYKARNEIHIEQQPQGDEK